MTACYVCGRPIEPGLSFAMRVLSPGPGLVQVCSARCAEDRKFSLRGHRRKGKPAAQSRVAAPAETVAD